MTPPERYLLERAKDSNGGGVSGAQFPTSVVRRMKKAGFVSAKKGYVGMIDLLVITPAGRHQLEELIREESKNDPANDGSDPTIL